MADKEKIHAVAADGQCGYMINDDQSHLIVQLSSDGKLPPIAIPAQAVSHVLMMFVQAAAQLSPRGKMAPGERKAMPVDWWELMPLENGEFALGLRVKDRGFLDFHLDAVMIEQIREYLNTLPGGTADPVAPGVPLS